MSLYNTFRRCLAERTPVALATVVESPTEAGGKLLVFEDGSSEGSLAPAELTSRVTEDALRLLREERPDTITYALQGGGFSVFVDVYPAPPQLVIVGATHAAVPLTHLARMMGYRVIVADARATFARPERFPDADRVLKGWPQDVLPSIRFDSSTYVVLLSHDARFDIPTLEHALPSPVPYIGAIGSRKTQRERFERLREAGYSEDQLSRVFGPVGLDLGARTMEETALAIMAEILAVRRGRKAGFLGGPK